MRMYLMAVLLLLAVSCNNGRKLPKGVLPKEKMESVLWDMLRADEMVALQHSKDTSINRFDSSVRLYQQVLKLHRTDQATFTKSFKYYQSRPDLLKPVFDSLQKRGYTSPGAGPAPMIQ
ncbi:MAG TPA: DUF4296 domain-containing protein [Chitinophagaceae bacterium]